MHIKFILPRFHTNMFYPTKLLLKNNFRVSIDCAYRGFNENNSLIKSKIIEESLITRIFKKLLTNKMNKFYLPKIGTYLKHFKNDVPDIIIIRPYNFLFFFFNINIKYFIQTKINYL